MLSKKEKRCAFLEKFYKTLFSGHAQHVLAKSHFWASKFSKSLHWHEILYETGKQCAFHENCTRRSFPVMRSTFWPNRIFERQSCQNRHYGLKFYPKRENSALLIKIVQNALFRSCGARFCQMAFLSVKAIKIVTLAINSVENGKQCAFHENCTKRSFQVMRSTFWPNRICERQSSQNRETGLKFSSKRENSALSMKIVHNALFRSWAGRFGQIAILSVKVLKIVTLAWNSLRNPKAVRFPWKLYKTLFSGHAQHVLGKSHFWASKFSKSSHWPEILSKKGKQRAFYKNCTKRSFQVKRSTFWPNRIFERQSCQNRHYGLKFYPKRENSALLIKIVQNALFRSCAARFGQIAFLSVKVFKIVTLAWNCLQNGKTVRFPWKLYITLFSGHAQDVLAKSRFWAWKFSKSWNWPQILFKKGKQCAFHENCTKRSFQVMRSTFWANRIFERQSSQNRKTGLKFSSKRENSALFIKLHKTLVSGHAEYVLAKSDFWASKFSKSWNWPQILFKKGKQCACNKILQNALFRSCAAQFGQNAFLSVKVPKVLTLAWNSRQNEKTMRFMKIVQNALFRSCAARFAQIAFLSVKVLKIVTLAWNSRQNGNTVRFSLKIVQNALFRSCAARFGQIAFLTVKVLKIVTLA